MVSIAASILRFTTMKRIANDYFRVPLEIAKPVYGVPGTRAVVGPPYADLPRSVLPLIEEGRIHLELERQLLEADFDARCAARDRQTKPQGWKLRPHQHVGVEFVGPRRGVLIGDEMRTGKTPQSLMCHDFDQGRLVVVSPLPVREVWRGWIERIFPGEPVSVFTGRTFDKSKLDARILLAHYDVIGAWQTLDHLNIGTLIFDEAHVLSKRKTARTQAAALLSSRSKKTIALTGTPLWNKPLGLWPILSIIAPGSVGSYWEFATRYTQVTPTAYGNKYEGTAFEDELKARLTEIMLLRRWKDVAHTLPKVTRDILVVDVTPDQRLEIDIAAEAAKAEVESFTTIGALSKFRAVLGEIKLPIVVENVKADLDSGERVIIWTWHRAVARKITKALHKKYPTFLVTGDVAAPKREIALAEWRKTPGAALVITIAVGQVGIDLSAARIEIFAEVDFTPALIAQAEMRPYNGVNPINVRYVVADHPCDRQLVDALTRKLITSDAIGVPAAEAAIDVLKNAFGTEADSVPNMDRLLADLVASADLDG